MLEFRVQKFEKHTFVEETFDTCINQDQTNMFPSFHEEEYSRANFPFRAPSYNFMNYQSVQSLQVQSTQMTTNYPTRPPGFEQWADAASNLISTGEMNGMIHAGDNAAAGDFIMENVTSVATAQYQFQGGVGNLIEASRMVNISGNLGMGTGTHGAHPLPPPSPHHYHPALMPPVDDVSVVVGGASGSGGGGGLQRQKYGEVVTTHSAKKYRRMIKNRESAARSRARKQAYTNQLEIEVKELRLENEKLKKGKEIFLKFWERYMTSKISALKTTAQAHSAEV